MRLASLAIIIKGFSAASVPKKNSDEMWKQSRDIMAEGQSMATQERCAKVREQYTIGRPFLLGLKPITP